MDKLQIIGNAIVFQGVTVAELRSDVPATLLEDFMERLGHKPGLYHPRGAYDRPGTGLNVGRNK